MKASVKMLHKFYRGWYSPPNGIIANAVLGYLGLNIHGQTFEMLLCLKQVQNNVQYDFDRS